MSIRSSIFTNKSNDPEYQYISKGVLPPLVSPTLPAIYKSLSTLNFSPLPSSASDQPRSSTLTSPSVTNSTSTPSTASTVVRNGSNYYVLKPHSASGSGNKRGELVVRLKLHTKRQAGLGLGIVSESKDSKDDVKTKEADQANESSQENRSPRKKKNSPPAPPDVNQDQDQSLAEKRKEKSALFIGKSKHFRNLAASKKRESDKIRHDKQQPLANSLLLSLESVITFIISFDYEDKSRLVEKKLITDKSWVTLEPYLNSTLKIIRDNMTKKNNFQYLLAVASLLKGLCLQHLINITLGLIKNLNFKVERETDDQQKVARLKEIVYESSLSLVEYQKEQMNAYKAFEKYLNYLEIKLNFPQTFKKRSLVIDPVQKQESLKPETDSYYIPLSSTSSLQEVILFSHRIMEEFSKLDSKQ